MLCCPAQTRGVCARICPPRRPSGSCDWATGAIMPTATPSTTGLLDPAEAAGYLAVDVRRVRQLWQTRKLAGIKVGRAVRFTVADLDAYIARQRVEAAR